MVPAPDFGSVRGNKKRVMDRAATCRGPTPRWRFVDVTLRHQDDAGRLARTNPHCRVPHLLLNYVLAVSVCRPAAAFAMTARHSRDGTATSAAAHAPTRRDVSATGAARSVGEGGKRSRTMLTVSFISPFLETALPACM